MPCCARSAPFRDWPDFRLPMMDLAFPAEPFSQGR